MIAPFTIEEIEFQGFNVKKGIVAEEVSYLIFPQKTNSLNKNFWTKENLIFRSSIWNSNLELISASFPKFFNLTEAIDVVRDPNDSDFNKKDITIVEKKDGSTLIVSKYKGEVIHRTRGTFNAEGLDNGFEIAYFKEKYPCIFKNGYIDNGYSLIFEWTTPTNKIVIDYGNEPELSLIGAIDHRDYSLLSQSRLDKMYLDLGCKRPKSYKFNSIAATVNSVKCFEGEEGVVVYFNKGNSMKKVKGDQYLKLHRFKSNATINAAIDLFFMKKFPKYEDYVNYIQSEYDFECFTIMGPYISLVYEKYQEIISDINNLSKEIEPFRNIDRKTAAKEIISRYHADGLSHICFSLLDNKKINDKSIEKMLRDRIRMQDNLT